MKAGPKETDPNALNYFEAPVLLEYLFDTYGREAVLTGCWNNSPLSEVCGRDYPGLYAELIEYLREVYGPGLGLTDE